MNNSTDMSQLEFDKKVNEIIKPLIRLKLLSRMAENQVNECYLLTLDMVRKTHKIIIGEPGSLLSLTEGQVGYFMRHHKKALEILGQIEELKKQGKSFVEILQILASTPIYH